MSRKISLLFILFALLVFASACSKKPAAVVNGDKITQKDVDSAVALRVGPAEAGMKDTDKQAARAQALQGLIAEKLVVQEARAKGITASDAEVDSQISGISQNYGKDVLEKKLKDMKIDMDTFKRSIKDQIMIGKLIEGLVPAGSVTDEDAMKFYKSQPAMFLAPARANVRMVQTTTPEEAEKIAAEMKAGGFDKVADKYLGSKTVGVSDYSWTPVNLYGPEISKALSSLKEGSFGGPFKTHDGYLLIGLKEKKPSSTMGFDEVKNQVKVMLLNQKKKQALMDLIARKKAASEIKINN